MTQYESRILALGVVSDDEAVPSTVEMGACLELNGEIGLLLEIVSENLPYAP